MMKPIVTERTSPAPPKRFGEHASQPLGFPSAYHRKGRTKVSEINSDTMSDALSEECVSSIKTSVGGMLENHQPPQTLSPSSRSPLQKQPIESREAGYSFKDGDLSVAESIHPELLSGIITEVKGSLSESSIQRLIEDGLAKYGGNDQQGTTCQMNAPKNEPGKDQNVSNGCMNEIVGGNVEKILNHHEELARENLDAFESSETNLVRAEVPSTTKVLMESNDPHQLPQKAYMFVDRYDLLGRKIIDAENFQKHISTTFTSNRHFRSFSNDFVHKVSLLCSDIIFSSGFAVDSRGCESMIELYNHELDQHLPGYSLNEVCELIRSEVPTQRKLARQILSGILNRRDTVVCCQPYCTLLNSVKKVEFAESGCQKDLSMFRNLNSLIYRAITETALECNDEILTKKELSCTLMTVLLFVTPTDLPPELPFLIVQGLSDKYACLEALDLTKSYLFSQVEEFVSNYLSDGILGIWGLPALLSPHGKREHVPYDEHITSSLGKYRSVCDDSSREVDEGTFDTSICTFSEFDVIKCRYSRADVFVSSFRVVFLLRKFVADAVQYFDIITETDENLLLCGILSADILQCLVRKSSDRSASTQILNSILLPNWKNCVDILNFNTLVPLTSPSDSNRERFSYYMTLLVFNVIQTSTDIACALWNERFATLLRDSFIQNDRSTLSRGKLELHMRILTCYICYGMGIDLLQYILTQNLSIVDNAELGSNHNSIRIYQIMEEASLVCSRYLERQIVSLKNECDINSGILLVIHKILSLVTSSLVTASIGCSSNLDDSDSLLRWASELNFVSTVIGINTEGCLSSSTSIRGIGLLNQMELLKGTTLSQVPAIKSILNEVTTIRELSKKTLCSFPPSMLSIDTNSLTSDMSLHNWAHLEHQCATCRFLSALVSTASTKPKLQQSILSFVLRKADKTFRFITLWGRNMVSAGLVGVQIDRVCSVMALCALHISESVHANGQNVEDNCFDVRDRIVIHTLPYLGKLFVYNMIRILEFFLRKEIRTEGVQDLIGSILVGSEESMQIGMTEGFIKHKQEEKIDLQSIVECSEQYLHYTDKEFSSTCFVHLSQHFCLKGMPLNLYWPYSICLLLKRHALVSWIDQLMIIETSDQQEEATDFSFKVPTARKIIILIHLATMISDDAADQIEDENLPEEISQKIMQLLTSLSETVQECEHFAIECYEAASSLIMTQDVARRKTSSYDRPYHDDASLVSLTERVLDHAMSYSFYQELYVSSLIILLTPSLSWRSREMIWRGLGSVSILHLLETNFLIGYMPNLVSEVEINPAVLLSIVHALQSLRSTDDRNWIIVGYGIFQLCTFLHDEKKSIKVCRSSRIQESITSSWLQDSILRMVKFLPLIRSVQDKSYCQQIPDLKGYFINFCIVNSEI